jgi:hypothetical protein
MVLVVIGRSRRSNDDIRGKTVNHGSIMSQYLDADSCYATGSCWSLPIFHEVQIINYRIKDDHPSSQDGVVQDRVVFRDS